MFQVGNKSVGKGCKPFVIAEVSANHGGSVQRAKETILAASRAGADAVKIQTYTPDTMTLDSDKSDFMITEGLWKGYNLYQLYEEAYTPFEWHKELFDFAKLQNILLFSTPFDETAVDLLETFDVPAFKIASFELTDLPLIEYVASKGRPMFISTGMSGIDEIAEALECCYKNDNSDILLFHCISSYPAEIQRSHLGDISYLANYFDIDVGLSDHTITNLASVLAIAKGASAIEKHFKLDETECGPDASFSMLPDQLKNLCEDCSNAFEALKSNELRREPNELVNKRFRRSIYFVKALAKGQIITEDAIKRVRPGFGLEPKYFNWVLGQRVTKNVEFGEAVTMDVLSDASMNKNDSRL